jgi:hypothetical protein
MNKESTFFKGKRLFYTKSEEDGYEVQFGFDDGDNLIYIKANEILTIINDENRELFMEQYNKVYDSTMKYIKSSGGTIRRL